MKDTQTVKRLQEEIRKAIKYADLLKDSPTAKVLRGYVVGIQFAVDIIIGGNARSLFDDEMDKIVEEKLHE